MDTETQRKSVNLGLWLFALFLLSLFHARPSTRTGGAKTAHAGVDLLTQHKSL